MASINLHCGRKPPLALGKRHSYDPEMVAFLRWERRRTAIHRLAYYKHCLLMAKAVCREEGKRYWISQASKIRHEKKRITRNMGLALAFMRGTPYFKCEAKRHEAPDALHIASIVVACLDPNSPEKDTSVEGRLTFRDRWICAWLNGRDEPWLLTGAASAPMVDP